uniref:Disease resistance protein At4g27190-like leucine-rich repeats domain-containing protein n=1 Tax=Davidia involucrata TaxID=16924 RepID=A0A5B7C8F8_DAVIN
MQNLYWCDGIECIWPFSISNEIQVEEEDTGEKQESSRCIPLLQSLEILRLHSLENLNAIIKRERRVTAPAGTFSNLKEFAISMCHKIKKLFPPGLLQHLQNLESIQVRWCKEMEEIIAAEDDEEGLGASSSSNNNNSSTIFTLPKLKIFKLSGLPKLKSICKGVMACDSIEVIALLDCPELKRVPFSLPLFFNGQPSPTPHALKEIWIDKDEKGWWESVEWDHPNAKNVLQPFMTYN